MEHKDKSDIILYRVKDNGLEVFLMQKDGEYKELPRGEFMKAKALTLDADERIIELDPVNDEQAGMFEQAYAVEADWHDIPSLKSIIKHDLSFMKDTVKRLVPDMMNKGTFVAVKDALKRVAPSKYKMLRELKDILTDRNSTRYM